MDSVDMLREAGQILAPLLGFDTVGTLDRIWVVLLARRSHGESVRTRLEAAMWT